MLIHELRLAGLLSFGPDTPALPLQRLNVFVGLNGSGKSNLIEAIGVLRSSVTKLAAPMRGVGGGGVTEWIWKGAPDKNAIIDAAFANPSGQKKIRHYIEFGVNDQRFELIDERIENESPFRGHSEPLFFYKYQYGMPVLSIRGTDQRRHIERHELAADESILSQRRDPDQYPELALLADGYEEVRLYREWSFGRSAILRAPQPADLPNDRLEENFSNFGLFLNHLKSTPKVKRTILAELQKLYQGINDFDIRVKGGTVEVFLTEEDWIIPASRLSDGTLRFLCLLAILCDPNPPPLICIEEPELGLHPDMLPSLAEVMLEASLRTQIIVTTHSDILVDAMTENPEYVVIVEKHKGCTQMKRLDKDELGEWLDEYRLGKLWTKGQIGGVRW